MVSFAHPNELSKFVRHAQYAEPVPVPVHLKLELLYALEDDALLAESRNPGSKFMWDEYRPCYDCPSESEYLDITGRGKLWREAMRSVPSGLVEHVAFDQTLPQTLQIDRAKVSLHWETTLRCTGMAMLTVNVSNRVTSMATILRMRRGGAVTFDVFYDTAERPTDGYIRRLDESLRKLSE